MTVEKALKYLFAAAIIIIVVMTVNYLSAVLLPFAVAWLLAYLLYPLVKFVQYRLKVKVRAIAILLTMLFVGGVVAGIVWLIIPPMIEQFGKAMDEFNGWLKITTHSNNLTQLISTWISDNRSEIEHYFRSVDFSQSVKQAVPKVFDLLGQAAAVVVSIVASCVVLLYMFFILLDYEYLTSRWIKIFPMRQRPFWQLLIKDVEDALNRYIRGQATVATLMGIMFCIGLTIIDFPMAIGLGILIGIMDMVPYLHTFALIPAAFLSMIKAGESGQPFWVIFGMVVALFIIIQIITESIVIPKVMGKAMGLNPAILLLSLSVWGSLLGFIGLIIALPLTTLLIAYWQRYVTRDHQELQPSDEVMSISPESAETGE